MTRTPMHRPFIGAVVFNRITRAVNPAGSVILYGWQWHVDETYTWVSEWR